MSHRFLCALLAVALIAGAGVPARAAEPYEIDVILALTGPGAFLGAAESKTLAAAERFVNQTGGIKGRPVKFVISDDATQAANTVQLANAIIAKHPTLFLGPNIGAGCYAVIPLVKNGPVQYCFAPTIHPTAPSYTFSGGVATDDQALVGIRYLHEKGLDKIAMLSSTDASGQDGETVNKTAIAAFKGTEIVANEHFGTTDVSVTAQLARIKTSGAQVIYVQTTGTPLGTVLKGISDLGITLPILTNSGNINYAQMAQYASFMPPELLFTGLRYQAYKTAGSGPVRDADKEFIAAMAAVGVAKPDITNAIVWDPIMISIKALRALGTDASPETVRDYIASLHGYAGINGIMDFRDGKQRGVTAIASLIVRWDPKVNDWVAVSKPGGFLK